MNGWMPSEKEEKRKEEVANVRGGKGSFCKDRWDKFKVRERGREKQQK